MRCSAASRPRLGAAGAGPAAGSSSTDSKGATLSATAAAGAAAAMRQAPSAGAVPGAASAAERSMGDVTEAGDGGAELMGAGPITALAGDACCCSGALYGMALCPGSCG